VTRHELLTLSDACIHCGFCLPVCPTYTATGNEGHSPRGRIALVRALAQNDPAQNAPAADDPDRNDNLPPGEVGEYLDACLGCRACEPACPSSVPYGRLLERGRAELRRRVSAGWFERALLRLLGSSAGVTAAMRLAWLARRVPGARLFARAARLAPNVSWQPWSRSVADVQPALSARRGAIALLPGCVTDHADREDREAVVHVLRHAGFDVHVPRGPLCCGALHAHQGDDRRARAWHARLAAALRGLPVESVVTDAAGCGAYLQDHADRLPIPAADALVLAAQHVAHGALRPIAGVLGLDPPVRVAWDPPCHLEHGQRSADPVRALLAAIPDVDVVAPPGASTCCGSAGLFNVLRPEEGARLGAEKANAVLAVAPDIVVTANAGCRLQIQAALRVEVSDLPVRHAAVLIAAALR